MFAGLFGAGIAFSLVCLVDGFTIPAKSNIPSLNRNNIVLCTAFNAYGELCAPNAPKLDVELRNAALVKLSWEQSILRTRVPINPNSDGIHDGEDNDSCYSWECGERWAVTRLSLVDMWVIPRDMSNGSDSRYSAAAEGKEAQILRNVPQLLRLEPRQIVTTAKTILVELGLPPALLRSHPNLLTYPAPYIRKGWLRMIEQEKQRQARKVGDVDEEKEWKEEAGKLVLEACRDTPGLLVEAIEEWIVRSSAREE